MFDRYALKGQKYSSTMGTDNTFALTARITHVPFTPKVPLRSALGYALLRFQRVLFAIILSEHCHL